MLKDGEKPTVLSLSSAEPTNREGRLVYGAYRKKLVASLKGPVRTL